MSSVDQYFEKWFRNDGQQGFCPLNLEECEVREDCFMGVHHERLLQYGSTVKEYMNAIGIRYRQKLPILRDKDGRDISFEPIVVTCSSSNIHGYQAQVWLCSSSGQLRIQAKNRESVRIYPMNYGVPYLGDPLWKDAVGFELDLSMEDGSQAGDSSDFIQGERCHIKLTPIKRGNICRGDVPSGVWGFFLKLKVESNGKIFHMVYPILVVVCSSPSTVEEQLASLQHPWSMTKILEKLHNMYA